jgi:heme exporter protein C
MRHYLALMMPAGLAYRLIPALALVLVLAALVAIFIQAPTEATLGDVQRIFYFHVASAWTAFLAFFVVFGAGIAYLRTRALKWDALASSSAEIGVIFTGLALATGSIWAKQSWGSWWEWEPRLATTLLLFLIYLSYLMLRATVEERGRRATFSAVFGIIGFVDVPIVFMSIRWWRSIHPAVVTGRGMDLATSMLPALFLSLAAFTVVYLCLLLLRSSLERSQQQLEEMRQRANQLAGGEVSYD